MGNMMMTIRMTLMPGNPGSVDGRGGATGGLGWVWGRMGGARTAALCHSFEAVVHPWIYGIIFAITDIQSSRLHTA
jgi:hypothetical protein